MDVQILLKRYNKVKGSRSNWDSHWQEIAHYVIPKKDDIWIKQNNIGGEKKTNNQKLYDATAIHSNELLASALHGMLTNPSVQWFELSTGIPELDDKHEIRLWLQKSALKIHQVLNNSNFQTEIHEVYLDLASFGTGLMRIEEDDNLIVRFNSRPIFEAYVQENRKGIIDTIFREFNLTHREMIKEYGEDSFTELQLMHLKQDLDKEEEIVHIVCPRDDHDIKGKKGPKGMNFGSYYVWRKESHILKESGFEEFPYIVPRWTKISGETYGRSPAMKALPDIKMLNVMMKTIIRGAQKVVDPPLMVPDDGFTLPLRTTPGGTNYYRAGTPDEIKPLSTNSRVDLGYQLLDIIATRVRQAFFIDQLQLNEGPQMTATEVMQRTEEKLRLLGPILGRQHFELLKPLVNRVFGILARKEMLPPDIPEEIQGMDLEVRYSSMIARAQRAGEAENINRVLALAAPLAQVDPSIMDNVNSDNILKHVGNIFNVPREIFRSEKEVKNIRVSRAQQQQQEMQQQQQLVEAETVQKMAPLIER